MDYKLAQSIRDFAKLLNSSGNNEESDDEADYSGQRSGNELKPGDIGSTMLKRTSSPYHQESKGSKKQPSPEIWKTDEVQDVKDDEEKITPKYDVIFKQKLTTEDIYMQMGNKTPSSVSCEHLVYKISLPGTKSSSNIQLKISEDNLNCSTDIFELKVYTPHKINPAKSDAKWDQDSEILVITVQMEREFDFLNS